MSFSRGPLISTEGLSILIDAGNNKSYPNAGTQVLDLAGKYVLEINGVTYTDNNYGSFNFDGTDDYIDFGSDIIVSSDEQGWTAEYWFRTTSSTKLQHFNSAENDEFNANWLAILNQKLAVWNRNPGYWKYGSTLIQNNVWYQAVFVCDEGGVNYRFYINGEREGGDHVDNEWNPIYSSFEIRYVGRYEYNNSYSRYFIGEIPIVKIYNRSLSDSEVLKNYEANKSRFII